MPDLIANVLDALDAQEDLRAELQERQDRLSEFAPPPGAIRSGARPGSERPLGTSGGRNGDTPRITASFTAAGSAPSAHGRPPRSPSSTLRRMDAAVEQADATDGPGPAHVRRSSGSPAAIADRSAGGGAARPVNSERPSGCAPTAA